MTTTTGDRAPEFDLEETHERARAALRLSRPLERPARLPPVRVHARLRGGGARPAGEPRVLPQRPDGDRLRLVRHVGGAPGVEEGARRRVHVRLGLLAARRGREGVRRLQRGERRAVPRHVPDRQGRHRDLVAREGEGRAAHRDGPGVARRARTRPCERSISQEWGAARPPRASSACTASRATGGTSRSWPRRSPASTCSRPTCSGTAPRRTSRRGTSRRTSRRSWRRSGPQPRDSGRALVRRPARVRARRARAELVPTARPARPRDPPPPAVALFAAENARRERAYVSFEEGIDRRYEESQLHGAPRELVEEELRDHLVWTTTAAGATATARPRSLPRTARWPRSRRRSSRSASRRCSCSARARTSRTTTCSTRTAKRSATCSRSSSVTGRAHGALGRARRDGTAARDPRAALRV